MTSTPGKPVGSKSSARRKALIGSVVTVFALAALILGITMFSSPERSGPSDLELASIERSQSMYDDALAELASGDATAAAQLLTRAIELDPNNKAAAKKLAELDTAEPTQPTPVEPTGTVKPPADPNAGYTSPVADLATLLPKAATGYDMSQPLVTGTDAQITGEGVRSGPMPGVRTATFFVHDMGSTEAAESFVDNQTHTAFPSNAADVTVNGLKAYFGTDGDQIAVIAYSRGRFAFEVILAARPGTAVGTLLDPGIASAKSFPSSR